MTGPDRVGPHECHYLAPGVLERVGPVLVTAVECRNCGCLLLGPACRGRLEVLGLYDAARPCLFDSPSRVRVPGGGFYCRGCGEPPRQDANAHLRRKPMHLDSTGDESESPWWQNRVRAMEDGDTMPGDCA